MTRARGLVVFLLFSLVGAGIDLWTKYWAFEALGPLHERNVREVIPGFLSLELATNPGAAFGMFPGQMTFFYIVSAFAGAVLGWFAWTAPRTTTWRFSAMLGMLGAGVLGNLYDRIAYGAVRDFIVAYAGHPPLAERLIARFGTYRWPTFNVADAFICVGVALLLIHMIREGGEEPAEGETTEKGAAGAKAQAASPPAKGG